jgi:transposase, IS5 family
LLNNDKKEALWEYQTREVYSSVRKTRKIVQKACINHQNQHLLVLEITMYRKEEQTLISPENFLLASEGKLSSHNRWVIMASLIPWQEFEEEYASLFSAEMGAPAKSFRVALGALIIKEKLGISDRETVEQIKENPYLQYFLGMSSYSNQAPFDASMLVHFRERTGVSLINKVNQLMVKRMLEKVSSVPEVAESASRIENEKKKKKSKKKMNPKIEVN